MGTIIIMVQDIKGIVTKNMIGTVATTIINTEEDYTDMIITTANTTGTVIICIGIIGHTSILFLVGPDIALTMDIDAMGASILGMKSFCLSRNGPVVSER